MKNKQKEVNKQKWLFWGIMALGFVFRILMAGFSDGFVGDVNCFMGWADRMVEVGCGQFYSDTVFTDYSPGYMYFLYPIGLLRHWFPVLRSGFLGLLLIKMPAILCDMGSVLLLYILARHKKMQENLLLIAVLFLGNPAVWINSVVWGQVDSVYTFFLLLCLVCISMKRTIPAYFAFAVGILVKPQTLMFTPVVLFAFWMQIRKNGKIDAREFGKQAAGGIGAILAMVLASLPFGLEKVLSQYLDTMSSYPYASVNAFNFWNLFGFNWASQDAMFLFLPCQVWGTLGILVAVALSVAVFWRFWKRDEVYYIAAAVLIGTVFMFSVRMHERYLYPILALLLFAYMLKREHKYMIAYLALSAAHYANVYYILYQYDPSNFQAFAPAPMLISLLMLLAYLYLIYALYQLAAEDKRERLRKVEMEKNSRRKGAKGSKVGQNAKDSGNSQAGTASTGFSCKFGWKAEAGPKVKASKERLRLTRYDVLAMLLISVLYGLVAFYDLGDKEAPDSFWVTNQAQTEAVFDFGESRTLSGMAYYLGNYENREVALEIADAAEGPYRPVGETITMESVFCWNQASIEDTGRFLRIRSLSDKASIGELVFLDENGSQIAPVSASEGAEALVDEAALYPGRRTFRNGTYFDEIYHARTAYEYIHGLYSYENTHPPLGKILIAAGMLMFGENPFGWRFMGTLFGVLMLPALYLLAKRLFQNSFVSTVTTVLFAVDFMHFAQTRIATIDVFVTLFIMLMYYFMFTYLSMSFYDTKLSKTFLPLGLCGICMGLGAAAKWTGAYAGVGLAVLFFYQIWTRYREYCYAKKQPSGVTNGIEHSVILSAFYPKLIKTLGFCMIFFVVVPMVIYTLSYLPFSDGSDAGLLAQMLRNQETMFSYHTNIESTHPFSSRWYQWPILYRPIWYYSGAVSDTVKEGISSFGNPLIWWVGIPVFFYMLYRSYAYRDQTAGILAVGYLAQYLPWMFVERLTFIYHYFPSVPFVVLMIGYAIFLLVKRYQVRARAGAVLYAAGAAGLFAMFYPVLSGHAVAVSYVQKWLTWFQTWILI